MAEQNQIQEQEISALATAQNPATAPELLQELAESEDKNIRQAVASNPNTPTAVLWKLGEEFPEELLKNPVFTLLMLENPGLVLDIPEATLDTLLKQPELPEHFLEQLAEQNGNNLPLKLANHPQTPKKTLKKLAAKGGEVLEAVKLHVNQPGKISGSWDEVFKQIFFFNSNTVLQQRQNLGGSKRFHICKEIGLIPEIWYEYWAEYYDSIFGKVTLTLPDDDREPDFLHLQKEEELAFLYHMTRSKDVPVKYLEHLANHSRPSIRQAVADNAKTPAWVLEKLALDEASRVRIAVSLNPNTPMSVVESLSKDLDEEVFYSFASNPRATREILEKIFVSTENPTLLHEMLARNPNTPSEMLEKLATMYSSSESILCEVAAHANCPLALMQQFASHENDEIRLSLIDNPQIPLPLLYDLAESEEFKSDLEQRIEILEAILQRLIAESDSSLENYQKFLQELLELYIESKYVGLRMLVLSYPKVPAKFMKAHASSFCWLERYAIALNPSTPSHIRDRLTLDANRLVRAAALSKLQPN